MNCIITGGAGFVASHLIEKIKDKYETIYLVDNLIRTNGFRNIQLLLNDKVKFVYGNIESFDFSQLKDVSTMYHLAATRINRCAKFNEEGHSFIADGGFKIVDYCAKNKIKLFFASSASVYDSPKKFPILESDPCIPPTLYGSAKLYTEHLILNYDKMYGFNYAINRFFSVYGPRMDCEGVYTEVIFNWLNNIKNGNKNITVYGNPDEKVLDLVFVKDVVNAIDMTTSYNKNDTYNVSTESGTTLSELIKCIEHVTNVNLNVQVLPENRNDIEKKRVGSTEKLRNIGWQQNYSLKNGIKETYEWIAGL